MTQKDHELNINDTKNKLVDNINKLTLQELDGFINQMAVFIDKSQQSADGKLQEGEVNKDFISFLIRLFY
ncbi:MAG: hypothetical protein U9N30_09935 [Campylobacterota bacterium]|nr:hypothetical protein [Campylobacterota bacterium]